MCLSVMQFLSLQDIPRVFIKLKVRAAFLGLIMHFCSFMLPGSAYFLISIVFCGIMSFYVFISDANFLVTSFSIFDQCLADKIILLCSFCFICSVPLG